MDLTFWIRGGAKEDMAKTKLTREERHERREWKRILQREECIKCATCVAVRARWSMSEVGSRLLCRECHKNDNGKE